MAKYLYNGIELPEIPEWNKETYPYVVLAATGNEHAPYVVYCCKLKPAVKSGESVRVATLFNGASYRKYNAYMGWEYTAKTTMQNETLLTGVFWSNTDIYYGSGYSDDASLAGTLYLSASDPVLVEGSEDSEDNEDIVETDFMLYNGVKLPKLPEWDKETYKYALIVGPYTVDEYPDAHYYHFAAVNLPMTYTDGKASVIDSLLEWQVSLLATTEELAGYLTENENVLGSAGVNAWAELENVSLLGFTAYEPILWANYYILNSDGSVYLYPSDPVPVPDPTVNSYISKGGAWSQNDYYKKINGAWVKMTAYVMQGGKWVKVVAKPPEQKPIAYLYNGVQLPPLPDWDMEKYPYVTIYSENHTRYLFKADATKPTQYADLTNVTNGWYAFLVSGTRCGCYYDVGSSGWSPLNVSVDANLVQIGNKTTDFLWTNTDLYYNDVLAYAATEPVPVYE